ncbi:MAG: hypothetical protein ABFS17_04590 [Chloroflexota bacterium]
MDNNQKWYLRTGMLLLTGLTAGGFLQYRTQSHEQGWFEISAKIRAAEFLGWVGLTIFLGLAVYVWFFQTDRVLSWLTTPKYGPKWVRWLALPLVVLLLSVYPILMFGETSQYVLIDWTRQAIFVWLVVMVSAALAVWRGKSWAAMLPCAASILAVGYHLATYLPGISNYPFALGWSETTRYYVASTFFDHRIYGIDLPMVFRDFTRYLMQAVPFLVKDSPLWVHRLWQAALRFGSTYFAGYLLAKRYQIKGAKWVALFTMWAGLFFFQGPVFYNLMVNVLLVIWLVKADRFWRTLAAVAGISVWAGLSRINWIPMPGLMAATFYLLEQPITGKDIKAVTRYLWKPAAWVVVGTLVGLGVQQGYAMISGNPEEIYYASFTSYLLWDRLMPNPSYRLGILPHVLLLSAPLLVFVGMALAGWRKRWQWIRPLGLTVIAGGLFAGGLVVSVKIGGGTNLHNMDVFLVILMLIAAEIFFGRAVDHQGSKLEIKMPAWLQAVVFAAPIFFVISFSGGTIPKRDMEAAQQDLNFLQEIIDRETADGGEVLFISQRHLITFGMIENVDLVHSHEKLLLQEMVMSQNAEYLKDFRLELIGQRYSLIIHDPLPQVFKNVDKAPYAAENNVVFSELSPWFACSYREFTRVLQGNLVIFMPADVVTCEVVEE